MRMLAVSTAALLVVTLAPAQAMAGRGDPARSDVDLPELQQETPVPGADSTESFQMPVAPGTQIEYAPDRITPIDGATDQIILGDSGTAQARTAAAADEPATGRQQVASLPLWIGPARSETPTAAEGFTATQTTTGASGTWTVTVPTRAETEAVGIDGVLMKLEPSPDATPVDLTLKYEQFEQLYGAGWGSRLRLVQFPECFLTTPDVAGCSDATEVDFANNATGNEITATVAAPSAPAALPLTVATAAASSTGAVVLAATGGESGDVGDYKATSLQPTGKWTAGGSSGNFSWSYPIDVPPVAAGPKPAVSLDYSSQSVDGRTSTTNNQASWVGDGWDYHPGFIERTYRSCADDKTGSNTTKDTGDLCWGSENAVMSLNGTTVPLVKDNTTGVWKPVSDNGTRVEQKFGADNGDDNGEYWLVTTPDGSKYHFGLNRLPGWASGNPTTDSVFTVPVFGNQATEPCHQAAYENSACTQAWRWNLDYVEDTHANAMALYWKQEKNHYAQAGKTDQPKAYVRGGWLDRIEYGLRSDSVYSRPAPAKVTFVVDERCLRTPEFDCSDAKFTKHSTDGLHWPDVPVDSLCKDTGKCYMAGPTFWTRKWLATIRTEVATASGGNTYRPIDSFELKHNFLDSRVDTNPPAWLDSIRRTGHADDGAIASLPPVTFHANAVNMPNRQTGLGDPRPPFVRLRVEKIFTETGGGITVTYSTPDPVCSPGATKPLPEANTSRCFPAYWAPDSEDDPKIEWFNKYVVEKITEEDFVAKAPPVTTEYRYLDGAAWAKDDNEFAKPTERTWSEWRGYARVQTVTGKTNANEGTTAGLTENRYFRGMHGDPLPSGTRSVQVKDSAGVVVADDLPPYQGTAAETIVYAGDGLGIVSREVTTPWSRLSATQHRVDAPDLRAYKSATSGTRKVETVSTGTRTVESRTIEFDETLGLPTRVEALGDAQKPNDETCTVTSYLTNSASNIVGVVDRIRSTATDCASADSATPDLVLSDNRTAYDGQAFGVAPLRGDATSTEAISADGTGRVPDGTTEYDAFGRVVKSVDADGNPTTTAYTPATNDPPTQIVVSNALGHATTTTFDVGRGLPLAKSDPNARYTTSAYDPLGRLVKVWMPERSMGDQSPSLEYSYSVTADRMTVVTSLALKDDGTYSVGKTFYDGLLRTRQTQNEAVGPGRVITSTEYNGNNLPRREDAKYFAPGQPSDIPYQPTSLTQIPMWTETRYDGLNRATQVQTWHAGQLWTTAERRYGGDYVIDIPPGGSISTRVWTDALGRDVKRDQYTDAGRTTFTETKYEYDRRGNPSRMIDADGNVWTYEYDARARRIATTDPDKGRSTYTYDSAGRTLTSTDSRGVTLARTYDALGRQTSLRTGSAAGPLLSEWTYDAEASKGLLKAATQYTNGSPYVEEITGYDLAYRVTGRTIRIPAAEGSLAGDYNYGYTYTAAGAPKEVKLPAAGGLPQETVVFRYNSAGLPISTSGRDWYTSDITYDPYGNVLRSMSGSAPNRLWTTNFYDESTGELTKTSNHVEASPYWIGDTHYGYDKSGNITYLKDRSPGASAGQVIEDVQCFNYDARRMLTQNWTSTNQCATGPVPGAGGTVGGPDPYYVSYTYDDTGNRLTEKRHDPAGNSSKDTLRTFNYAQPGQGSTHQLSSVTTSDELGTRTAAFTYDSAGNTKTRSVQGGTQNLDWDENGRLRQVVDPQAGTSDFVYDADGNRLLRRTPQGTTLFLGETEVTRAGNGSLSARRYYAQHGAHTVVRSVGGTNTLTVMVTDQDETSLVAVGLSAGMPVDRRKMTAFGETRGAAPVNWPDNKGFVGGETDQTTGLTHLGAREYDPQLGRFISVDPVIDSGDPLQLHPYIYGYNNPLYFSDANGLWGMPKWAKKAVKAVQKVAPVAHVVLDVAGMVPVVGEAADLANAALYAAEGDWQNAAISAAGAIPIAGNVATTYRLADNAVDASRTVAAKAPSPAMMPKKKYVRPAPVKRPEPAERTENEDPKDRYVWLYHGTTTAGLDSILENGIDPTYQERNPPKGGLDFGPGFYVTENRTQAEDRARAAARSGGEPVVLAFRVPKAQLEMYKHESLKESDPRLTEIVDRGRANKPVGGGNDYIEGPMLGNPREYAAGARANWWGHQIAVLTSRLASALMKWFVGYYRVY